MTDKERDERGRFKPGNSGGEPHTEPSLEDVAAYARKGTIKNIKALEAIRDDPTQTGATRAACANALLAVGHGRPAVALRPDPQPDLQAKEDANPRIALQAILGRLAAEADAPVPEPLPVIDQIVDAPRPRLVMRSAPELLPIKDPFEPGRGERISIERAAQEEAHGQHRGSAVNRADSPWNETLGNRNTQFGKWE